MQISVADSSTCMLYKPHGHEVGLSTSTGYCQPSKTSSCLFLALCLWAMRSGFLELTVFAATVGKSVGMCGSLD